MSFEDERRRSQRYPLKLAIKLHRGAEELDADVVNASEGGCLLVLAVPVEPGEVLSASIPALMIPRTDLRVLRCQAIASGYSAAVCFETQVVDEPTIARVADEQQPPPGKRGPVN